MWREIIDHAIDNGGRQHQPDRPRCLELANKVRKVVGTHGMNPVYQMPAVEVVPAPWTDPDAVERTRVLLDTVGQAPIVMRCELDGFVMNRMQGALLHEAFRLVASGAVSAEDVDRGIRDGLA